MKPSSQLRQTLMPPSFLSNSCSCNHSNRHWNLSGRTELTIIVIAQIPELRKEKGGLSRSLLKLKTNDKKTARKKCQLTVLPPSSIWMLCRDQFDLRFISDDAFNEYFIRHHLNKQVEWKLKKNKYLWGKFKGCICLPRICTMHVFACPCSKRKSESLLFNPFKISAHVCKLQRIVCYWEKTSISWLE